MSVDPPKPGGLPWSRRVDQHSGDPDATLRVLVSVDGEDARRGPVSLTEQFRDDVASRAG